MVATRRKFIHIKAYKKKIRESAAGDPFSFFLTNRYFPVLTPTVSDLSSHLIHFRRGVDERVTRWHVGAQLPPAQSARTCINPLHFPMHPFASRLREPKFHLANIESS
jgi:hypothetical protein